jgi:uncharacterized membrane protein YhaH (DUF805 family)
MTEEITLEEYKKAYFEVYKEQRRKSFFMHLAIYILVNTVSSVINFIFTPKFLWVIFPIIFWGIGIIWNFISAFLLIDKRLHQTSLEVEQKLAQRRK